MANNPVKPGVKTAKSQFQTSENDAISWNGQEKMATKFYDLKQTPPMDACTSGAYAYGDAKIELLNKMPNRKFKG